jgi:Outer membrane protein beta-barrel domain
MPRLMLALALALAASGAHADDSWFYAGAGISRDNIRDIQATVSDLNATSWKALIGFRPIHWVGVEADYIDLGSQSSQYFSTYTHLDYKATAAYGVVFAPLPLPFVDVFGKLGVAHWNSSGGASSGPNNFFSLSDNGNEFAWGVGGMVHLGNIGARLEYENFHIRNTNGANVVSLEAILLLP